MSEFRRVPHVANVIHPRQGSCFRWVYGNSRNDYPTPCPDSATWRGVVLDPKGRPLEVDACDGHADSLVRTRRIT